MHFQILLLTVHMELIMHTTTLYTPYSRIIRLKKKKENSNSFNFIFHLNMNRTSSNFSIVM